MWSKSINKKECMYVYLYLYMYYIIYIYKVNIVQQKLTQQLYSKKTVFQISNKFHLVSLEISELLSQIFTTSADRSHWGKEREIVMGNNNKSNKHFILIPIYPICYWALNRNRLPSSGWLNEASACTKGCLVIQINIYWNI